MPPSAAPPRRPLPPRKKAARRPLSAFPPPKSSPGKGEGEAASSPAAPASSSPRLLSLDAFRGLTVAGMLLVNNAALDTATPAQFVHAEGVGTATGVTFADLIFPWFLLIVGVAIPFAAHGKREQNQKPPQKWAHVAERVVVLLAIGMLIDGSIARTPLFTLGVLQLIGLAYGVARVLYAVLPPLALRVAAAALLLGLYGASLTNGLNGAQHGWSETANWVARWNEIHPYHTILNGLPSVWPTAALVLLGTVVGNVVRKNGAAWWLKTGLLGLMAGAFWAAGSAWANTLPMSKPFWTPPYLLYAAGWGVGILGVFYLLTDAGENARLKPYRAALAYPFTVLGANPLVAYAGAILIKLHFLQEWHIVRSGQSVTLKQAALDALIARAGRTNGGWLYMAGYLGVWWLVCAILYRKRIFLRA